MNKTTKLKQMLQSPQLEFLMEAHSGISAKIVEEAGFKGIWGSGLAISGSLGVRDNNEASWTQVLEVVEFMSDATTIPILIDGDTGYGNFNNMRRLVKKLEQRDIAGVCIEDKLFPKTNSFLREGAQPLADIDEFCGKIKAGKDIQKDDDFVIVARVEAFIAGWGLQEALNRAEAYCNAGADAILIHSKLSNASEVFDFIKVWGDRSPVAIVPTKYYTTPTDEFRKYQISLAIWANQVFRGSIQKMQEVAQQIYREQNLLSVEDSIVSIKEVFRLQDDKELALAEEHYLCPKSGNQRSAIILASTRGEQLGQLTQSIPKTMIKIGKKSILERAVEHLNEYHIKDISVVAGYRKEAINLPNLKIIGNDDYKTTGELVSLSKAIDTAQGESIILFGDILFKKYFLSIILDDPADIVIIVDTVYSLEQNYQSDFVHVFQAEEASLFPGDNYHLKTIFYDQPHADYYGEWIGMMKLTTKGVTIVKDFIQEFRNQPEFQMMDIRDMFNQFIKRGIKIKIQTISGHRIDVNNIEDFSLAGEF
ncbi:MAG: phosphoenolpyruvate mutase [Candidatus Scalindua sp. AMX11]|nr:MAG: phosphoenolpyruvate mutase [Candidatus Scalindua sp.]NOG83930.1 phosphoenolpyruvate mutase [Planctomycetota bacterium]RZV88002.1 MAG: phosphoenolpyruvate mutase [Candidatus Scalindua sp. SCAELEC01]TDE64150.1 MAG: phosphoenolpyruvate mutase [Candidatus Scalindua sp. AMX11]GJQ58421.1 MAG: phosphoenolpyruvate mutase [Candidatus Scalindua sp.]